MCCLYNCCVLHVSLEGLLFILSEVFLILLCIFPRAPWWMSIIWLNGWTCVCILSILYNTKLYPCAVHPCYIKMLLTYLLLTKQTSGVEWSINSVQLNRSWGVFGSWLWYICINTNGVLLISNIRIQYIRWRAASSSTWLHPSRLPGL